MNSSKRILLVDDDAQFRNLSAALLSHVGYETETAEDGQSAWEALQAKGYDLLITDQDMPRVSGIELVKKLRSAKMTLPVILASGALPTEELERHAPLQVAAMLLKPFTYDELLGTVRKVLDLCESGGDQRELFPVSKSETSNDRVWL